MYLVRSILRQPMTFVKEFVFGFCLKFILFAGLYISRITHKTVHE